MTLQMVVVVEDVCDPNPDPVCRTDIHSLILPLLKPKPNIPILKAFNILTI